MSRVCVILVLLLHSAARPRAEELYYTSFENFPIGYETQTQPPVDGWLGSHAGLSLYGVDLESVHLVAGLGNASFIGSTASTFSSGGGSVNVRKPLGVDPVASGKEVVTFHVLMGIRDSTTARRDDFEFGFYNNSNQLLASIQFDNTTLDSSTDLPRRLIFRSVHSPINQIQYQSTGATYLHDTIQELVVRINYRTNRWTVTLDGVAIFSDVTFHGGTRSRNLGSIAALMQVGTQVLGSYAPGNNMMLFDEWLVRADAPADPVILSIARAAAGPTQLTWNTEAGYSYQVQYADDLSGTWLSNLPGSLSTATTTGTSQIFTDPGTDPRRFYRVMRLTP